MKTLKVVVELDDEGNVHQVYLNKSLLGSASVQFLKIHEETPEQEKIISEEMFPLIPINLIPIWLASDPPRPLQA